MNTQVAAAEPAIESVAPPTPEGGLTVDEARAAILASARLVCGAERVSLRQALGRVLAEDVVAPIDVPAYDNSAVDGFALSSEAMQACQDSVLQLMGTSLAGHALDATVPRGGCVRVMTGAAIPRGCDAVIAHEACRVEGERVVIGPGRVRRGANLRQRGEDLRAGQSALRAGKVLRPADLGLIGSLGQADVAVRSRLRVAFLSTGDELRSIGDALEEGCIFDSNRHSLWGMLTRLGCDARDLGLVRDEPRALEDALKRARESADVVITTGGVGGGAADHLREALAGLGTAAFWRIAMRPGRPMAFGHIDGPSSRPALVFGLPGNPVAAMVAFYMILRDALLLMMGAQARRVPLMRVKALEPLGKLPGRMEFQRAVLVPLQGGELGVRSTGHQGSAILRSMSEADGLVVLEAARGRVEAGELVSFLAFEGLV